MVRLAKKLALKGRRLRRSEKGAAGVEFALVSVVFFITFLGIIELGMLMVLNNGLEDGVDRAARLLRTGQTHKQNISEAEFRQRICDQVVLKASCNSKLIVDVRSYPDFASINNPPTPHRDSSGNLTMDNQYQKGAPRQVLLVRAFYEWSFFTPLIGQLLSNTGGNSFLLTVATTFRTEPYGK